MKGKETQSNKIIRPLNTPITESLKTGFTITYVFDILWKRFYAITNDWQYSFIWTTKWEHIEILQEIKIFSDNSKEKINFNTILKRYWVTEYCFHINSMWWWDWFMIENNQLQSFSIDNTHVINNYFTDDLKDERATWKIVKKYRNKIQNIGE